MSNPPYGLNRDPFVPPATLSAREASRLVRRRVSMSGGDGAALFAVDTTDEIHRLAGGVPDAILALAARAMRLAADENAPAVTPDHVRRAFAPAQEVAEAAVPACGEPDTVAAPPAAAQTPPPRRMPEDDATGADDVPPIPAGGFALPTRPSDRLDRDEREWVSRFISGGGPAGAPGGLAPVAPAPAAPRRRKSPPAPATPPVPAPMMAAPPPSVALAEELPALVPAAPLRRRSPRSRRPARRGGATLLFALAVLCIVAFVARRSLQGELAPPAERAVGPLPAAVSPATPPVPAPTKPERAPDADVREAPMPAVEPPAGPAVEDEPTLGAARRLAPAPAAEPPAAATAPAKRTAEPARRTAEAPARYALEVATFIFEERARVERDRLSRAGLRARVASSVEYGSRVYRVVVGGYPDPAAAERAADSLLANGAVLQARVIATGR